MRNDWWKRAVALLAVGLLAWAALGARESGAKPIPCDEGLERFVLTPTNVVTVDGFALQRSATTGLFEPDGGRAFDVNASDLMAVDDLTLTTCKNDAKSLTLSVVDPFTGQATTMSVVTP